jgi:hypothetical protein
MQIADARIDRRLFGDYLRRAIGGAVVDHENFESAVSLGSRAAERGGDRPCGVERRYHHRNQRIVHFSPIVFRSLQRADLAHAFVNQGSGMTQARSPATSAATAWPVGD